MRARLPTTTSLTEGHAIRRALVLISSLILLAHPTLAQQSSEVVSLDQLIEEALENNPEIQASRRKFEAAKARSPQAASLPDPTIGFMSTNMGNIIPFTTIRSDPMSNAGISINQEIPFPGKLKLKGEMLDKEAQSEFQNYIATRLNVVSRVKVAYYELYYLYKAIEVIDKNKDLLERLAKIAEAKYVVGKGIQQDVLKAQTEISVLIARLTALEQRRESVVAEINSLLNRPPHRQMGRPADFEKATLTYSVEELIELAHENSPMVRARRELVDRNSLALDLAKKQYYPDFMVGGFYGATGGGFRDTWQLRFDVRVPLYFWRKQRYGVEESTHSLIQARKEYENTMQLINFSVKDQYLQAVASEKLVNLYSTGIIPQATLALESSLAGYEVGTLDFLTVLSNFTTILEYQINYWEELTNFQKALARLEELTAVTLTK